MSNYVGYRKRNLHNDDGEILKWRVNEVNDCTQRTMTNNQLEFECNGCALAEKQEMHIYEVGHQTLLTLCNCKLLS